MKDIGKQDVLLLHGIALTNIQWQNKTKILQLTTRSTILA